MSLAEQLGEYVAACFIGIWITPPEPTNRSARVELSLQTSVVG